MTRPLNEPPPGDGLRMVVAAWGEDFGRPVEEPPNLAAPPEPVFTAAEVEAARRQAWNEGYMTAAGASRVAAGSDAAALFAGVLRQADLWDRRLEQLVDRSAVALAGWLAEALLAALPDLTSAAMAARQQVAAGLLRDTLRVATRIEVSGGDVLAERYGSLEDAWRDVAHRLEVAPAAADITIGWPGGAASFELARTWQRIRAAMLPVQAAHEAGPETLFLLKQEEKAVHVG